MTFRTRVIFATATAAAIAVLLACAASYFSTRNAVARSVDESLYKAASGPGGLVGENEVVTGVSYQLVLPDGTAYPQLELPVDATVLAVARGQSGTVLRTVQVTSGAYRELIVPLPAGTQLRCESGPCVLHTSAAQVFSVSITGQQHQLRLLLLRLLALAFGGVLLAVTLGWLAARAALAPLENVTNQIEEVAETSNISYRLEEGSTDELGRLRRVFNKLLSSVDDSQRLQRQLVLDASHELRTPLTSLRTNAQVLRQADRLTSEELVQITDDMVAQVDELAVLISDLAELARGDGITGATEDIHLEELVEECVETARTHARVRDVTVDSELAAFTVNGRRDRVTRAVNNLLLNAIKFAPMHGHVLVSLADGVLRVADDGPGVANEDVPFVFDRFWRSPRARALPGSGLGLAIVSQVASEMDGSVWVGRSESLGGAEFSLRLPGSDDEDNAEA